jgi:hypothetical protein
VPGEPRVLDREVDLEVLAPGALIEVVAADGRKPLVDDGRLRVEHRAGQRPDLHAAPDEGLEERLDRVLHDRHVALRRHQDANGHASAHRAKQSRPHVAIRHEVRVGDVDAGVRPIDPHEVLAVDAAAEAPLAREHPHGSVALAPERAHVPRGPLPREAPPRVEEQRPQLLGGVTVHFDHVVAPGRALRAGRKPG